MPMILAYHGGRCCGIKTIYGMTYSPVGLEDALEKKKATQYDLQGDSKIPKDFNLYPHEAPKESGIDRLDRYLAYLKDWRPKGLVEINLNISGYQDVWIGYLQERGFKMVTSFLNSNTYNKVGVFHLVMDNEGDSKDSEDVDDDIEDDEGEDDYDDSYEDHCTCEWCVAGYTSF